MKIYKTNKKRILKDAVMIGLFAEFVILINSGFLLDKIFFDIVFFLGVVSLYFLPIGFIPVLKVLRKGEILYRSDYGVKHFVNINKIKKITKSSGVGGYRHALYINYVDDSGKERSLKIKSSLFKKEDIVDFVRYIKSKVNIQTNKELEDFIA